MMKSSSLFIDSNFESGNLEKVYKSHKQQEYHLFMSADTNTRGHQQWFFFRVRNMRKGIPYKFNIWNFSKPRSLFGDGMRLSWRSKKRQKYMGFTNEHESWQLIPKENMSEAISYFRSKMQRSKEQKG